MVFMESLYTGIALIVKDDAWFGVVINSGVGFVLMIFNENTSGHTYLSYLRSVHS